MLDEVVKVGCLIVDIVVGMYVYFNILVVFIKCGCDGCGSYIDLLMLEVLMEWMSFLLYYVY